MCFKIRRKRHTRNRARASPPREQPGAELSALAPSTSRTVPQQALDATPSTVVQLQESPAIAATLEAVIPSTLDPPLGTGTGWKMSTWNATKLALDVVRESSDVLPALKSVAGGLSALISHAEVSDNFAAWVTTG